MKNDRRGQIKQQADRLTDAFVAAGALPVETDSLMPAEILLDLYGEDIRARAFITHDSEMGEQMLRPDFTVPIVQRHMAEGAEPARYTYNGPVWRKQPRGSRAASEYIQVGYELFDRANPAEADAEVFALFSKILRPHNLRVATGDIGILLAAISALKTTERRRAALRRHVWRPQRFVRLLERYGGQTPMPAGRKALLEQVAKVGAEALLEQTPLHGLRSRAEVLERIETLQQDAAATPVSSEEVLMLETVLEMNGSAGEVLQQLQTLAVDFPALSDSTARMTARHDALETRGIDAGALPFQVSFGRTNMEYYDGFVFGFFADNRPDLPMIASGGRYDALTRVLGQGREIAAVGGIIRPESLIAMQEGA